MATTMRAHDEKVPATQSYFTIRLFHLSSPKHCLHNMTKFIMFRKQDLLGEWGVEPGFALNWKNRGASRRQDLRFRIKPEEVPKESNIVPMGEQKAYAEENLF